MQASGGEDPSAEHLQDRLLFSLQKSAHGQLLTAIFFMIITLNEFDDTFIRLYCMKRPFKRVKMSFSN